MKKALSILLVTKLCLSVVIGTVSSNTTITNDELSTPLEVLNAINKDMEMLYGEKNYYPLHITKNGLKKGLREDLIQKRLEENKASKTFRIVYGDDHGDPLLFHKGKSMYKYAGWTVNGEDVTTEGAPWWEGWSGRKIQDFDMIKYPWADPEVLSAYGVTHGLKKNDFDLYVNINNPYLKNSNGTFEQAILTGLNEHYAGKKYNEDNFMYQNKGIQHLNKEVYDFNAKPKNGGDWRDYVHILEPPTYYSWGEGRIYHKGSNGNIYFLGIPIAPFSLQEDLVAYFETIPSTIAAGTEITVGVRVTSSYSTAQTTDFEWDIKTKSGEALAITYSGSVSGKSSGNIVIPAYNSSQPETSERIFNATFTMPESEVEVRFKINKNQNNPEEINYENNQVSSTIKLVEPLSPTIGEDILLNYNILSKRVKFPLANGQNIVAQLTLPPGNSFWTGNATGELKVNNDEPTLFRYFLVENNPPVNIASETIIRNPSITTTLRRVDFGDDPVGKNWLIWSTPNIPIERDGQISFGGNVKRPYEIIVCHKEGCYSIQGEAPASFTPGTDTRTVKTYIYNGQETIPAKTYKNEIEQNTTTSKTKELYWTSEPYQYNVIRWMAHEAENGSLFNWQAVDGQYKRTFTQQASGTLTWSIQKSMGEEYHQARETAKSMTNRKSLYDKAVFATDRQLQRFDYPIKSGYYFNPAGKYTFTIETVTYKPTTADTPDHRDLVNAIVKSFRYETDLMYINSNKEAVNLLNQPLTKKGNTYERKPAALSVQNNRGVDGEILLTVQDRSSEESRYSKKVEEIEHSQERTQAANATHEYWKNILEGYSESGTINSHNQYKYREYVKSGQKMYRITEKTTVTIEINKDNRNVYTHAHMPDGNYYVRAWIDHINLTNSSHAYNKITDPLRGITSLDQIQVTVKGSMHDDVNN